MAVMRKMIVAAAVAATFAGPVFSDETGLEEWFSELSNPETTDWERLERRIMDEFAKSGSRIADLLLKRGRDALEAEDDAAAIEHLTALTDHAPEFAEGWNMLATAYFGIEEYGLAIEAIGRALALNPRHFEALTGLGIMLEQLENPEAALKAFRAAHALNPHREVINDGIARLVIRVEGRDI